MIKYYSIKHKSFGQLARYETSLNKCSGNILNISAEFLRPYCVAYLDQLFLKTNIKSKLLLKSKHSTANRYLQQCGFKYLHPSAEFSKPFPQEFIAPIKRFSGSLDMDDQYVNWVKSMIIKHMPKVNNKLEKKIIESLWEIIQNSLGHSESKYGVTACGQYYPEKKYFEIAFVDCGYGISAKVGKFLNKKLDDSDFIEWAMKEGNSTLNKEAAGLGLHIFRQFIKLNSGAFQIVSGNGYFGNMESTQDEKFTIKNFLPGTVVNIRINFDDNTYILK